MANELAPTAILPFVTSARPGRTKGATVTIQNTATGNRATFRFRKPALKEGQDEAHAPVFVDVMSGPDNESHFSFVGTLHGNVLDVSRFAKAAPAKVAQAKVMLDWTLAAAAKGDLRTVRVQHSGCCGRCGRKLTVPESIDIGLGPECANHRR